MQPKKRVARILGTPRRRHRSSSLLPATLLATAFLLLPTTSRCCALSAFANDNNNNPTGSKKTKTYKYFAFGSNMASSTMIDMRDVSPIDSTAAILPGHVLRFNVPGLPLVEPSWASIEPVVDDEPGGAATDDNDDVAVVHGVLYELSGEDFATICRTEGVPFAYSLHRCRVLPYAGDGKTAGADALRRAKAGVGGAAAGPDDDDDRRDDDGRSNYTTEVSKMTPMTTDWGVPAFTLRAARRGWRRGRDAPPSRSYLNVLIRGAREYELDGAYVRELEGTRSGMTLIGNGLAEGMLRLAERRKGKNPMR
ncbi:hypothetical protein ACHAW5_004177 [Stephanodiscus triporus]|uniref:gamma-glutamylcyclotransferase n=1 Tax=Stephanodiscus triporus TaxID=2934178 RepID=A0ABD3MP42_9STRA